MIYNEYKTTVYDHLIQISEQEEVGIERLNSRDPISYVTAYYESDDTSCGAGNAPTSPD
jgi:hypothetical protein